MIGRLSSQQLNLLFDILNIRNVFPLVNLFNLTSNLTFLRKSKSKISRIIHSRIPLCKFQKIKSHYIIAKIAYLCAVPHVQKFWNYLFYFQWQMISLNWFTNSDREPDLFKVFYKRESNRDFRVRKTYPPMTSMVLQGQNAVTYMYHICVWLL